MRFPVIAALSLVLACGPKKDPYAVETNEWDDVATALACDPNDVTQNCIEPKATTVRIDDEVRFAIASADYDAPSKVLTVMLKPGASLDARIKEGAVLYRGRKDRLPLMHRVTAMTKSDREVKLTLERVTAKEAFNKGRVRARLYLSEQTSTGQPLTTGLGVKQQPLMLTLGPADCSGNVFDKTVVSPRAQGTVKLDLTKCKFQLKAWVDAVLEFDSVTDLNKLELSVGGEVDASMRARLAVALNASIAEQVRIWEGPEIPFTVGGIVITVNPSLFAGYAISADATLTVEQGFDMTDSLELGFGYSDRLGWYSIDETKTRFTEFGPNVAFDGRLNAQAFILPRLDVKAFGFVGATVTLKTYAEAKLRSTATQSGGMFSGNLCTSLDLGLTPAVGAVVELFGVQLFNDTVDLVNVTVPIVQNRCTPYTGPIPSNCDVSSECCTDGQCPAEPEPGTTSKCKKGMELTPGKFRYRCQTIYPPRYCTTDAMCADQSVQTQDKCVHNSCEHPLNDAFGAASVAPMATSTRSLCVAPSCCQENSDCAHLTPRQVCVKRALAPITETGSCQPRP